MMTTSTAAKQAASRQQENAVRRKKTPLQAVQARKFAQSLVKFCNGN
jgi:hypothetical protein